MVPICPVAILEPWQFSRAFSSNWIFLWWYFFSLFLWRRRWWRFAPHTLFFLPWRSLHSPLSLWPGAVVREGCVEWGYFLVLHNFLGDEGMILWSLGFEFSHPYLCCTTYGFSNIGQSSTQDPTAFSAHYCPITGVCFGGVIDPLRFFVFLCSCPCLVVSF